MKKVFHTKEAPEAIGAYSQAVSMGRHLYFSGQIPLDPQTGKMKGNSVKEQTQQVMENIGAILRSAKLDYNDLVKITIFLTDIKSFKEVNEVYSDYFSGDYPVRSCVEVSALPKEALIEIEGMAILETS